MKPVGGRGDLEGLAIAGDLGLWGTWRSHILSPTVQNQLVSCAWQQGFGMIAFGFAILACAPVTD